MEVEATVKEFIERHLLARSDIEMVTRDESLLYAGLLDSTAIVELVSFVEQKFGVQVQDDEVIPANFETIEKLTAYIESKQID